MSDTEPYASSSFFWGVDFPGLTQEQANWIISVVEHGPYELHGISADPATWFSVRIDREGAEVLRTALRSLPASDVADGLIEVVEEWLEFASKRQSNTRREGAE